MKVIAFKEDMVYYESMGNERLPHDPAYKQFFSNPEMVESLLRDFVPEEFVRELDFSTLEQCSGSYVTDDLRERHDDIVWRLRWKGKFIYVYLVIEFVRRVGMSIKWIDIPPGEKGVCAQVSGALTG